MRVGKLSSSAVRDLPKAFDLVFIAFFIIKFITYIVGSISIDFTVEFGLSAFGQQLHSFAGCPCSILSHQAARLPKCWGGMLFLHFCHLG
jgi:hypothetical protein